MLTQRALFTFDSNTKKGMLSQQFVSHVVPPLFNNSQKRKMGGGGGGGVFAFSAISMGLTHFSNARRIQFWQNGRP